MAGVVATEAVVSGNSKKTDFALTLSQGVTVEVFTLANPYRVIVDMPDVSFKLPKSAGRKATGLISAYRYGLFAARKARVVIDTVSPVSIEKAAMRATGSGSVKLELSLKAIDAAAFGAGTGAQRQVSRKTAAATRPHSRLPRAGRKSKPVVVIDPGHGGIDPGALGARNVYEKNVVLAVAKVVAAELAKNGKVAVKLTRSSDVFVSLDKRLEFSEANNADLFVSLHADAIADKRFVAQVQGATVYTLSERASDELARRMAERENSADAIAGLESLDQDDTGDVRDILIDLVKRETANFSTDFSNVLVRRLKQSARLSNKPQRSAAFKVLKQAGTPSVLVELGYLSNRDDEKRLSSAKWRRKVAKSIAKAIQGYFDRHTAMAR
ncbi:MAG: N-acetylmuramoyl-L-alanine amidase [Alphaproteobacteria bacterium]|nr:N-acetylmuramoyl-L-alanine amidase [Alphaproteobacteria bacterium]